MELICCNCLKEGENQSCLLNTYDKHLTEKQIDKLQCPLDYLALFIPLIKKGDDSTEREP